VTRAVSTLSPGALDGLADALAGEPVTLMERPLLGFDAPADWTPLDLALARLREYGAVALTSPRAARAVAQRSRALASGAARPPVSIWAAGRATAQALGDGWGPVRLPPVPAPGADREGAGSNLASAMLAARTPGPVLYPGGEVRRDELTRMLTAAGVAVEEVVCYRAVLASAAEAQNVARQADVLIVGSPRVAQLLATACPPDSRPRLLALGSTTAQAAEAAGWAPAGAAATPTAEEVARMILALHAHP